MVAKLGKCLFALGVFSLGAVISAILLRWLMRRREGGEDYAVRVPAHRQPTLQIPVPLPPETALEEAVLPQEAAAPPDRAVEAPPTRDDLSQITGIGPVYVRALQMLGIETFAQLARQEADDLARRLREQGVRIIGDRIRKEDWIGQAQRLAAGS